MMDYGIIVDGLTRKREGYGSRCYKKIELPSPKARQASANASPNLLLTTKS